MAALGAGSENDALDPYAGPSASDVAAYEAMCDQYAQDEAELNDWLDSINPSDDPAYDRWVDEQDARGSDDRVSR